MAAAPGVLPHAGGGIAPAGMAAAPGGTGVATRNGVPYRTPLGGEEGGSHGGSNRDSWRNSGGAPSTAGAAPQRSSGPGALSTALAGGISSQPGALGGASDMAPVVRGGPVKPGRTGFSLGRGRGVRAPMYPASSSPGAPGSNGMHGHSSSSQHADSAADHEAYTPFSSPPARFKYPPARLLAVRDAMQANGSLSQVPHDLAPDAVPLAVMTPSHPMAEFVITAAGGSGAAGAAGPPRCARACALQRRPNLRDLRGLDTIAC